MNKPLSGWQLFGLSVIFFIISIITHSILVSIVGDVCLALTIVVGIRNRFKSKEPQKLFTTLKVAFKPRDDLTKGDVFKFIAICVTFVAVVATFLIISNSISPPKPGTPQYNTFQGANASCAGWTGNDLGC